jgi:hypothetical protein
MKDTEQLFIWNQVKIRNKIEITIPGSKTTFEFGPNLLGFKPVWKNLTNSPKLLSTLAFQNVNLD